MLESRNVKIMLFWICMAAAFITQRTVYADTSIRMFSVNNEESARSIAQSTTAADLGSEIKKHKLKPPDATLHDFVVELYQENSGFIPPASIACGSAIAIVAEDKNENRAPLPAGFKKYSIEVNESKVQVTTHPVRKDKVIVIDDKTLYGADICSAGPGKLITISLIRDKGSPLKFSAKTIDPKNSFIIVGHIKDDEKAKVLSNARNYEEFYANQDGLMPFVGETNPASAKASLECDENIIIAAFNKVGGIRVGLKDVGHTTYDILLDNAQINKPQSLAANDPSRIRIYSKKEAINYYGRDICQAEQNKLIALELSSPGDKKYEDYYIRSKNRIVAYNSKADIEGLWFPVGIIAGKPKKTENGIIFSAFPISAALGTRVYNEDGSFYFGASVLGSYALGETNKEQIAATTESKSFHGAAAGILFDINSYLYLMGAYQWSFVKDTKDPGWLIGFGIGAKFGSILAGK